MAITVNDTTISFLKVGDTAVEKVLVRQNANSAYTTVYYTETYEENITVSGKTRFKSTDDMGKTVYITSIINKSVTSSSGTVKVISATAVSSNVHSVETSGALVRVELKDSSQNVTVSGTVKVTYSVCFSTVPSYNVKQVNSTASHQFKLNSNGYYESQCKGVNNGWSLCKVEFNVAGNYTLQCISNGENNYDFGILSTINNTLSAKNTVDTANVKKSFKGSSSTSVQNVVYSGVKVGDYIYAKYRKDGSVNNGNDSLQFKVVKN